MQYVQTVLGPIPPEDLGFTLPHEHLLWDLRFYLPPDRDPQAADDPHNRPVTLENLGQVRMHLYDYPDNLVQDSVATAVRELQWYRAAGGRTICDCTSYGLGRDPARIREISRESGVHVVLGTGAFCCSTLPPELNAMDVDTMAALLIREIRQGASQANVPCGFLGEIGISEGLPEGDRRSLAAAAVAQKETGAAILIHQPGLEHRAEELFRIIEDNGGRLDRTVLCHCDPLMDDPDYLDHMAKSGPWLSFDFFGLETVLTLKNYHNLWLPTDRQRIQAVLEQIARGNLSRLLLSHDTAYKCMLRQYGGFGYAHLLETILPLMVSEGYAPKWIRQMTVENPARAFSMEIR